MEGLIAGMAWLVAALHYTLLLVLALDYGFSDDRDPHG